MYIQLLKKAFIAVVSRRSGQNHKLAAILWHLLDDLPQYFTEISQLQVRNQNDDHAQIPLCGSSWNVTQLRCCRLDFFGQLGSYNRAA